MTEENSNTSESQASYNQTEAYRANIAQERQERVEYAQTQTSTQQVPNTPAKKKKSLNTPIKTFIAGFAGAAVACLLFFGISGVASSAPGSSVTLGGSEGTSITVSGGDATLPEAVAAKVLPSVVNIDVYTNQTSFFPWSARNRSSDESSLALSALGSGVLISEDGYILTNWHVVENADALRVTAGGKEYEAKIIGTDDTSDLAVIKIDGSGFTAVEIGSSADLKVGQWVMAAGSPYGLEQSVSSGIVSAVSRTTTSLATTDSNALYVNMIQTDAAINSGNSGGPLVDAGGKLVGINTLIASSSGSSSGVGFAIPVDYAIGIAKQLIAGEQPSHAQLGVSLSTVNSSNAKQNNFAVNSGAYINSVVSGSAADKAGLKQGDIITKINNSSITSSSYAMMVVRSYNPGDTISVTYYRGSSEQTTQVTLGSDA